MKKNKCLFLYRPFLSSRFTWALKTEVYIMTGISGEEMTAFLIYFT